MQNQIDQGLTFENTKLTVEDYFSGWMKVHNTQLRHRSAVRYEQIARDYLLPYLGKHKITDLRLEHVEHLYQRLEQDGASVRTIRYVHSLLHRALEDAIRRGIVGLNAAHGARKPKLVQKEMQILDEIRLPNC